MALWYQHTQTPVTYAPAFLLYRDRPSGKIVYFGLSGIQPDARIGWYRFDMQAGAEWRNWIEAYHSEYQTLLMPKV